MIYVKTFIVICSFLADYKHQHSFKISRNSDDSDTKVTKRETSQVMFLFCISRVYTHERVQYLLTRWNLLQNHWLQTLEGRRLWVDHWCRQDEEGDLSPRSYLVWNNGHQCSCPQLYRRDLFRIPQIKFCTCLFLSKRAFSLCVRWRYLPLKYTLL